MSSPDRVQQISDLLAAALNLEPSRREAFILDASRGDPPLRDSVLRLLEESQAGSSQQGVDADLTRVALPASSDARSAAGGPGAEEFPGTARFQVRRGLGSGAFGAVYEAYDREQHRQVALKVLRRTDPAFLYQFKQEFRSLVDVRHPNLVELYELFSEGPFWFFTMELVDGVDFLRHVQLRSRLDVGPSPVACDVDRLRAASLQLARGIDALHDEGILHRDIKPGNILVSDDGHVRLLDFGLARQAAADSLQTIVAGTPAYMSPEQAHGRGIGKASDWYSFGVLMFQALTGWLPAALGPSPIDGQSAAAYGVDVPQDLEGLCKDLLQSEPSRRPSGQEVIKRLGGAGSSVSRSPEPEPGIEEGLIGRESHLTTLRHLLQWTEQGRAVVVNLHGRSGIGKSTIIRTFFRRVTREAPGVVALSGRCYESETVPFKALDDLVDGLSRYLKSLPDVDAEKLVPRDAQYLVRVFPVLAQVDAITRVRRKARDIPDSHELRERAFASLQDLLSRLADQKTVVLAVDDLQWGDLDSAEFLGQLLTGASPPSLLFLASYRSEDADTSPFLRNWRARMTSAPSVTTHDLEVGELSPDDSRALAVRLLTRNDNTNKRWAESIADESGGSPFLIDQLARHSASDAGEPDAAGSLQQVVEGRLTALPKDTRALLGTIALAGRPISRDVAAAAAGLTSDTYAAISMLVTERLVRLRETNGPKEVEVYHDRLRETIIRSLPPEKRRDGHLMLARALETAPYVDAAILAMHFQEGGDPAAAARHAFAAGQHASQALAFARAAQFYQMALDQGSYGGEELASLRKQLATALVHAGRGLDAAGVYLDAARDAQPPESVELKRLAAEQWLRSGRVEDGLDLLNAIARELGIWLPRKPWQSMLSIAWNRVRIAFSRLRVRERRPTEIPARDLLVLDVHWSLAMGLAMFDMVRCGDFQSRHLLLALHTGDRDRAAMAIAGEAGFRATRRGRDTGTIRQLLAIARKLSEGTTHPQALGFIAVMEGLCAHYAGEWRHAQQLSERADQILREHCKGADWERGINTQVELSAALQLGEWSKLADVTARLPKLIREATTRRDTHALHVLSSSVAVYCLASDRLDLGMDLIDAVTAAFPQNRFLVPHLWILENQVDMALYRGQADIAWTLVSSRWRALSRSLFLRVHQFAAVFAVHLRARTAITAAVVSPERRSKYLREAIRCARKLERENVLWAGALSLFIRAGAASVEDRRSLTLDLLNKAEELARAASMGFYVAASQHRRGMLLGGSAGAELVAAAESWASSQGVVHPSRVFDTFVPGRF
jgi:eukaryotic-like serine/threonine-protein kinase